MVLNGMDATAYRSTSSNYKMHKGHCCRVVIRQGMLKNNFTREGNSMGSGGI